MFALGSIRLTASMQECSLCREGNLEQAASFTAGAWEDRGASSAVHARDVLSEQYAPLVYHGGYKLAGTTQVSASRAYVFAGAPAIT